MAQGQFSPADYALISICLVAAVSSVLLQISFLNQAIARYSQVECIAIYQVTIIIFTVICALMLLGEAKAYTRAGLLLVFGCIILLFAGIQILAWKTNYLN